MKDRSLVPIEVANLVKKSEIPSLLDQIRPAWQSKNLIERVRRLLSVDPSSACQRLLNAAIHDLKEKIVIAGIDIAKEAAIQHKLPPIEREEDLENFTTAKIIDLAYRMGLLSRAEWRRVTRCYDIRQDLEHEDDEYEAGVEDCIYIFKTCIEAILSKDPVQLLRVTDVKGIVEEANPVTPSRALIDDFQGAPPPRQEEIMKFLASYALDKSQSEIIRQNSFAFLVKLSSLMHNHTKLSMTRFFQERISRRKLDSLHARVAQVMGIMAYLKRSQVEEFYEEIYAEMKRIGSRWTSHAEHGEPLRFFQEVGGLSACRSRPRKKILKWLVLTYLGEPGGRTIFGHVRNVFYSDIAASLIEEIITQASEVIAGPLIDLSKDREITMKFQNKYIARRFEALLDLIEPKEE